MGVLEREHKRLIQTAGSIGLMTAAFFGPLSCANIDLNAQSPSSPRVSDKIIEDARRSGEKVEIPKDIFPNELSTFSSTNFPYKIKYPAGWIAVSSQRDGKKIDLITNKNDRDFIAVSSEPTEKWISTESYAQNLLNQARSERNEAAKIEEGITSRLQENTKNHVQPEEFYRIGSDIYGDYYFVEALEKLPQTKVDGEKIVVFGAKIPYQDGSLITLSAVFIKNGTAWTISHAFIPGQKGEYVDIKKVERFQEILSSFRSLK